MKLLWNEYYAVYPLLAALEITSSPNGAKEYVGMGASPYRLLSDFFSLPNFPYTI
jgi:hypothetical protein